MESKFTYLSGHPAIVIGAPITISTHEDKDYQIRNLHLAGFWSQVFYPPKQENKYKHEEIQLLMHTGETD